LDVVPAAPLCRCEIVHGQGLIDTSGIALEGESKSGEGIVDVAEAQGGARHDHLRRGAPR